MFRAKSGLFYLRLGGIMGNDKVVQFHSRNGFIYLYNSEKGQWYKLCPTDELPLDVKNQIRELKEKADALKDT